MRSVLFGLSLLLAVQLVAEAQITSTFDIDADGWTLSDNNNSDPQTVNYFSTGGNPGGYVSATKTSSGQPYFWTSPGQFNGNVAYFSYGQDLTFDLQINHVPTIHSPVGDVHIKTPSGFVLVLNLPTFPAQAPAWSSHTVRLDETAGWRIGSLAGPLATKAQLLQYLSGVASFRVNIKYNSGVTTFTGAIDNVVLNQRTISAAPTISSITPTSGKPGESITINGNNFDPTPSNNVVFFGAQTGIVISASATSLTVTVPQGATYGKLNIINKTSGLSTSSLEPFLPSFNNGGRIIPASFDPKSDITLSGNYGGVSIADLDGDGWSDLMVANQTGNSLSLYRNLGTGGDLTVASFASPLVISGIGNQSGLYTKDLDNDGMLDIVSNYSTGFVMSFATLHNTSTPGNLSFETAELWAGLVYSGFLSEPFDVDGDGLIDLIAQHGNGSVAPDFWIAQNISVPGNIEFGFSIAFFGNTLDAGAGVTHGDLDGDNKCDLVIKSGFGGSFSIVKNNSSPGVISFGTPVTFASVSSQGDIAVADLNLDGKNDLAWKNGFSNDDVHIRINTNSGGALTVADFSTEIILDSDVTNYGSLSLGDMNGDGKVDILATDNEDVGIFENVYTGGVFDATAFVQAYRFQGNGIYTYPEDAVAGDLNGDGRPDIVVGITNVSPNRLSIYENKNIHTPVISLNTVSPLQGPVGSTVTITGNYFSTTLSENKVHFGDVNAMVLTATETELTVTVPPGASYSPVRVTRDQFTASYHLPFAPTFSSGVTFDNTHFAPPIEFTLTAADYDIDAADLNEDGKPDVIAEGNSNRTYLFRNTHTTGAISMSSLLPDDSITTTPTQNARLVDLNGDNKPDFVATNGVFRNISVGSEINFEALTNMGGTLTIHAADFNHDGKTDYVGSDGTTNINVFENRMRQGTGPFISGGNYNSLSANINFAKPAAAGGAIAADFDNDGYADIACGNGGTDNITVWRNNGTYRLETTSFTSVGNIATGDNPGRLYTGDLDVDGKMDIMLYHGAGTSATMISIFHNQSTPGNIVFNRVDLTNPSNSTVAHIDDLDGDGKPEIITTSESGNQFSIFKNVHTAGPLTSASFAAPFNTTVTAPRGLTTADLNLDGKPEIIITRAAGFLVVYENLIPLALPLSITITQQPSDVTVCEGVVATFSTAATGTTNITYQWQYSSDDINYVDITDNAQYAGTTTNTLTINTIGEVGESRFRCRINGDFASEVVSNDEGLFVLALPNQPAVSGNSICGTGSVQLSASGSSDGQYRWYPSATGPGFTGEVNSTFTTPVIAATTSFYVSIHDGTCESSRVEVVATVNTPPIKPSITASVPPVGNAISVCSTTTFTLSAPVGFEYLWSDGSTTQQISVTASGSYSVVVSVAGCASQASDAIDVTIIPAPCTNMPPVITSTPVTTAVGSTVTLDLLALITDPDNNLVTTSLAIAQGPASGAPAIINNGVLEINYSGIAFTGSDLITIEVCDTFGECTQQQMQIEVIGEIEIYNALSPNGDGLNDFFYIQYIDSLPSTRENKVSIYNRWGDLIFEMEDYDNDTRSFVGLSKEGNEIPSGIYFYKIEFASGRAALTGYLNLKR